MNAQYLWYLHKLSYTPYLYHTYCKVVHYILGEKEEIMIRKMVGCPGGGRPTNRLRSTLAHWAKALCDTDSLPQQFQFLQILCALNPPTRASPPPHIENNTSVVFLPLVSMTFNRITRVLSKHNIKTVGILSRKSPVFSACKGQHGPKNARCMKHPLRETFVSLSSWEVCGGWKQH
jgi:hypothetical protein